MILATKGDQQINGYGSYSHGVVQRDINRKQGSATLTTSGSQLVSQKRCERVTIAALFGTEAVVPSLKGHMLSEGIRAEAARPPWLDS